jgi:hypothetical protein
MQDEAIALGRSLIDGMRSRRSDSLLQALQDIDATAVRANVYGGSRHYLSRRQAASQELCIRANEIWQALRKACEASSVRFSEQLSTLLKTELQTQLAADQIGLEAQIAPKKTAGAFGADPAPHDLTAAFKQALLQVEPEIDLFASALKNNVAAGYAYSTDSKATAMSIPKKSGGAPLVFISYSHDSDAHKDWVRRLAEDLVKNGVDVILDQWHLQHGRDLTLFMEQGIITSDYVLMICTHPYVVKANERAGGVGYESLFLTSELLQRVNTEKLIPVIRQASPPPLRPSFVTTRLFSDLSDDANYLNPLRDLLHTLHNVPKHAPPARGASPFPRPP